MPTNNIVNGWEFSFTGSANSIPVNNIPSQIKTLLIVYQNAKTSGSVAGLSVQTSVNNGSSYISPGYASGVNYAVTNSASYLNQNITTGLLISQLVNANQFLNGQAWIYGINQAIQPSCSFTGNFFDGGTCFMYMGGGQLLGGGSGTNALQIVFSNGVINEGTFHIYGLS